MRSTGDACVVTCHSEEPIDRLLCSLARDPGRAPTTTRGAQASVAAKWLAGLGFVRYRRLPAFAPRVTSSVARALAMSVGLGLPVVCVSVVSVVVVVRPRAALAVATTLAGPVLAVGGAPVALVFWSAAGHCKRAAGAADKGHKRNDGCQT